MNPWLQAIRRNKGFLILLGAVAVAVVIILATSKRGQIDPVFVCSAGKHFDMRYVDEVATLGCFDERH
jgi:hypothetical protein